MRSCAKETAETVTHPTDVYPAWRLWVLDRVGALLGIPFQIAKNWWYGAEPRTVIIIKPPRSIYDELLDQVDVWTVSVAESTRSSGDSSTLHIDMSNEEDDDD